MQAPYLHLRIGVWTAGEGDEDKDETSKNKNCARSKCHSIQVTVQNGMCRVASIIPTRVARVYLVAVKKCLFSFTIAGGAFDKTIAMSDSVLAISCWNAKSEVWVVGIGATVGGDGL